MNKTVGELQRDENGRPFRMVGDKKIYQIEEKTDADRRKNEAINAWRMRNK